MKRELNIFIFVLFMFIIGILIGTLSKGIFTMITDPQCSYINNIKIEAEKLRDDIDRYLEKVD